VKVEKLDIPDVLLVTPRTFGDARGVFCETWNRQRLVDAGIACDFMQDNQSVSASRGTVRGLHFQSPPAAQAKLVRCVHGAILDVAVDVRKGSPTYGQHVSVELSAANWRQLFVPRGFAHGFATLTPDAAVVYKVDAPYSPAHDGGVYFASLDIDWGVAEKDAVLSDKDAKLPRWEDFDSPFVDGKC